MISSESGYVCRCEGEGVRIHDLREECKSFVFALNGMASEFLGMAISRTSKTLATATSGPDRSITTIGYSSTTSNTKLGSISVKQSSGSLVRRVFLRWNFLCVVCDNSVSIYDTPSLEISKRQETFANPNGLCAWSSDPSRVVMCCLGLQRGTVRIDRFFPSKSGCVFAAHDSPVAALDISGNGMHVVTISETGTLIRVHAAGEENPLLFEVRRTNFVPLISGPPKISTLFMSPTGSYVGLIEEHGGGSQLHVYKTPIANTDFSHSLLLSDSGVISNFFSKFFNQTSLWTSIPLRGNSCAGSFGPAPHTVIISSEDSFFAFKFDANESGKFFGPKWINMGNDTAEIPGWEVLGEEDGFTLYDPDCSIW